MKQFFAKIFKLIFILTLFLAIYAVFLFAKENAFFEKLQSKLFSHEKILSKLPTSTAQKRSFAIEIQTIGELEVSRSTSITSPIRGDLGKIVYMIEDGANVNVGDILVKMDPTPFEKWIAELEEKINDQRIKITLQEKVLAWEKERANYDLKTAITELEIAQLELNKFMNGEGPIELRKLQSAMQKAQVKYEETKSYHNDLKNLQIQNLFTPGELKQIEQKLIEEEEVYLSTKIQFESYAKQMYPMVLKKNEINCKRFEEKIEETKKSGLFKIETAKETLLQLQAHLNDLLLQLQSAKDQLASTIIYAQNPGMVVLKEDFRNGIKRKPRIGDAPLKNQAILDLPDLTTPIVKTQVKEMDLYKIEQHTPVIVQIDAYPDLILRGEIQSIGVLGLTDFTKLGDQKYFEVMVKLFDFDTRLRPGMTARITIKSKQLDDVLTVPIQSVFEFNKLPYCCIHNEGQKPYWKAIQIGWNNDQWVEVISGLEENDEILIAEPSHEYMNHSQFL